MTKYVKVTIPPVVVSNILEHNHQMVTENSDYEPEFTESQIVEIARESGWDINDKGKAEQTPIDGKKKQVSALFSKADAKQMIRYLTEHFEDVEQSPPERMAMLYMLGNITLGLEKTYTPRKKQAA